MRDRYFLGTVKGPVKGKDGKPLGPIQAAKKHKAEGGKILDMWIVSVPKGDEKTV